MSEPLYSPPFGQADLTNCERELIHLAGSIQPHGALLVIDAATQRVVQASANVTEWLGMEVGELLQRPLAEAGGTLAGVLRARAADIVGHELIPLHCTCGRPRPRPFEVLAHVGPQGHLIVELEPDRHGMAPPGDDLSACVRRFGEAMSVQALADEAVLAIRALTGYDRVMVYRFDADGHGEIIAEARDGRLDTLLGHRYPATDIPARARDLYLRNRVRMLVDVDSVPSPLVPEQLPGSGEALDMSMCHLRSMSPLHLQYLRNMGVTATLVASLVREGGLWGLIACHHYSPLRLGYAQRASVDVLAEVLSTRLAAIENYARTQVEMLVSRLELRLMEATSIEGDWRPALMRNARALLQPFEASGAALLHDGELIVTGEVPSTEAVRMLAGWVAATMPPSPFAHASIGRLNPPLSALAPAVCGVLAVELSSDRRDLLMWFRREQRATLTWAGDPTKPMVNDDPLTLSPRRSFEAWTEIVRGTSAPWSRADIALARAIGQSLRDVVTQTQAVRLLIAQHQFDRLRRGMDAAAEPVLLADAHGRLLFATPAFEALTGVDASTLATLDSLVAWFEPPDSVLETLDTLRKGRNWRGEWASRRQRQRALPLAVRADRVPAPGGGTIGYILMFTDLTDARRAEAARRHLEASLSMTGRQQGRPQQGRTDAVIGAILANASVAAMELTDTTASGPVAALIEELEASATRAAEIYARLRDFSEPE